LWVVAGSFFATGVMHTACSETESEEEAGCFFTSGLALLAEGKIDAAIAEFTMALKLDKKNAAAYYQRAKALEHKSDIDGALADYTQAIKYNPSGIEAYYYRAILYQNKKLFKEAIEDNNKVIEMDDTGREYRPHAYNNRGLVYYEKGEYKLAIDDFTRAAELMPRMANVYYNRACAYVGRKDYGQALIYFERELEMFPRSFVALHYSRAVRFFMNKKYSQSWEEVMTLIKAEEQVSENFLFDLIQESGKSNLPESFPGIEEKAGVPNKALRSW